jgi:EAL and modified HD-GYP domain-containing signal transduction protein
VDVLVARQPIFDQRNEVYGYELRYRSGLEPVFKGLNPNRASLQAIGNTLSTLGLDALTQGKRAFIRFTHDLLVNDYAMLLPPAAVVVEIPAEVELTEEVIDACKRLRRLNYLLALDGIVLGDLVHPLVDVVHLLAVDFAVCGPAERQRIVHLFRDRNVRLLARKVETVEAFEAARTLGYEYFQGGYFRRPKMLEQTTLHSSKLTMLRLLQEVSQAELDFDRIDEIMQLDVSLPYKLLSYMNSALLGLGQTITSLKHALLMLGQSGVRKWLSVVVLADAGDDVPSELIVTSVLRARFSERLAARSHLRSRSNDLFLVGLFSMIDALMRRPLPELIAAMPLDEDVKNALLGQPSELAPVYSLIRAHEQADWPAVAKYQAALGIDEADVAQAYHAALEWVATFSELTTTAPPRAKAAVAPPAADAGAPRAMARLV